MDAPDPAFAAVVLAGGRGSRLGGVDKAALELDGCSLLDRSLTALAAAAEVVVVGDPTPGPLPPTVRFTREEPRWGGPAAALLAGVRALRTPADQPPTVVVVAVDMPRVAAGTVTRLLAAATAAYDGSVLVDASGRRQLACALDRAVLARAVPAPDGQTGGQAGLPLHRLLAGLRLAEVAGSDDEARDVDTWEDLRGLAER